MEHVEYVGGGSGVKEELSSRLLQGEVQLMTGAPTEFDSVDATESH